MASRRAPVATDRRFRSKTAADYGPNERWQHSGRTLELTELAGVLAAKATEEHTLDVLVARGWITGQQREAGLRFKRDYHAAGLDPRLTGSYTPFRTNFSPFGSWSERSDPEESAYRRWRDALRILSPQAADLITTLACHDLMPHLKQAPLVREGLEGLRKHYGLPL